MQRSRLNRARSASSTSNRPLPRESIEIDTIPAFAAYAGGSIPIIVLVALFVTLIPTTIGALLSAIGIAGMDRLARFNVQAESTDKRFFIGLPSPTGAGLVATLVWLGASRGMDGNDISWLVALVVAGAGLLMVSSVKYHSFKELHIGRVPFKVLLGVIVAFAIVFLDPPLVLLTVAIVYVTVGLLMSLWRLRKGS